MKLRHLVVLTALGWPAISDAQSSARRTPPARVLVSRREVRVIFPRDTAQRWEWAAQTPGAPTAERYSWSMAVEGIDGERLLYLHVGGDNKGAQRFPSLRALVSTAKPGWCTTGMMFECDDRYATASVERGSVVLTLRDSGAIVRAFGMMPRYVKVSRHRPLDEELYRHDSVEVQYVAPRIPEPDSAFRTAAVRARRRYDASVQSTTRYMTSGGKAAWDGIWLTEGDSTALDVGVTRCQYDVCRGGESGMSDSGWTVADTMVARVRALRPGVGPHQREFYTLPAAYLYALRAGRTTVRVSGLPRDQNAEDAGRPPQVSLESDVIVTRPIERLEIAPRPDTVAVGARVEFRVHGLDRAGRVVEHLPASFELNDGKMREVRGASEPVPVTFVAPGVMTLTARLGRHADTVRVVVVGAPKR